MGIASWALGDDNPFSKYVADNRQTLQGAFAGFGQGPSFSAGLGNAAIGAQRGSMLDDITRKDREAEAKMEEMRKRYSETLSGWGGEYADLAEGVLAGGLDPAQAYMTAWERRYKPQIAPDPFTLGKGEIRYDGQGNMIAEGPAGGPDTIIENNIGGSDKFYDTVDAKLAEQTAAVIESGYNAQSNNIRIGELERLLGPGGAPQGAQGVMIQAAGSIGIPVEGLDDLQAAQALISQMVPGQRPAGSGTMSDADLALFKQSLPAIINQPDGNRKVLQTMKAINEYTIQQAAIAQRVANREISPAEGRALQAQVPNPLARTGGGAPSALPNGVTIRRVQ